MDYQDFRLRFERGDGDRIQVVVTDSPAGQGRGDFSARPELLRGFTAEQSRGHAEGLGSASARNFQVELGIRLFDALFPGEVRRRFYESIGLTLKDAQGLRLRIDFTESDPQLRALAAWPWELAFEEEQQLFLGMNPQTPLVRSLEAPKPRRLPAEPAPRLRGLLAGANPAGDLAVRSELMALEAIWRGVDGVDVEVLWETDVAKLRHALLRSRPHFLHIASHGALDEATGEGLLVVPHNEGLFLDALELRQLLPHCPNLGLVFLSACQSGASLAAPPARRFGSMAASLILGGVPTVVAMASLVGDTAAALFAKTVHQGLADGQTVEEAVARGRLEMGVLDWATPVVFSACTDSRPFRADGAGPELRTELADIRTALIAGRLHEARALAEQAHFRVPNSEEAELLHLLVAVALTPPGALDLPAADHLDRALDRLTQAPNPGVRRLAELARAVLFLEFFEPKSMRPPGPSRAPLTPWRTSTRPAPEDLVLLRHIRIGPLTASILGLTKS